jgi:hypothetical protein
MCSPETTKRAEDHGSTHAQTHTRAHSSPVGFHTRLPNEKVPVVSQGSRHKKGVNKSSTLRGVELFKKERGNRGAMEPVQRDTKNEEKHHSLHFTHFFPFSETAPITTP